jgi:hypothetical protein
MPNAKTLLSTLLTFTIIGATSAPAFADRGGRGHVEKPHTEKPETHVEEPHSGKRR